jgi:hypothetical protein
MDPVSSSSPPTLSDDYSASRQADTIEAGSILISLANSHKPSTDKQELEAAAVAMESMSKHHHRTYSLENRHHQTPIAPPHSMENEVQTLIYYIFYLGYVWVILGHSPHPASAYRYYFPLHPVYPLDACLHFT